MFLGRGFDFNDDGVNDAYVFGRVRPIILPNWCYWVALCGVAAFAFTGYRYHLSEKRWDRLRQLEDKKFISAPDAKWLVANDYGSIRLNVTSLSDDAAKALAQHKGDLYLNRVTSLSSWAAKMLAQHEGGLYLNAVTTLSNEAAEALAQHEGDLYLDGLTELSDHAAAALRSNPGIWLPHKFKR